MKKDLKHLAVVLYLTFNGIGRGMGALIGKPLWNHGKVQTLAIFWASCSAALSIIAMLVKHLISRAQTTSIN